MPTKLESDITVFFKNIPDVMAVIIFGSVAKNTANSSSDIDIAVLFGHNPDASAVMDLRGELEKLVKRDVDLVVLNKANPILKHQIFKYGQKTLINDNAAYSRFWVKSLNEYDDLKHIRAPIEQNMLKGIQNG